jgi:hypothetical protein
VGEQFRIATRLAIVYMRAPCNGGDDMRWKAAGALAIASGVMAAGTAVAAGGDFTMGIGDRLDAASGTALTAGGYALMPRRSHHWATGTSQFVIQIQAMGPFDIHYINPADDPMKSKR